MQFRLFHTAFMAGGGTEGYALTLVDVLREAGHSIAFYCYKGDAGLARTKGVDLHVIPVARFPRKLRDYYFHRKVARLSPTLDGIHLATTRVPVKDLVTCGGTHRGYMQKARKWAGPFDRLMFRMEGRAYGACRRVVVHSHLCAGELETLYGIPPARLVTLHCPIDERQFKPLPDDTRAQVRAGLGFAPDVVSFLFPSSGHRRKGLYALAPVFAEFAGQAVLAVTGRAPQGIRGSHVKHLGYVDDMPATFAAADYTIMASYYEPFGMVGVESILCGTKVVFEEKMGCLEVISPSAALTFSVWKPDTIRAAIRAALTEARAGGHRIGQPRTVLGYDPGPRVHVRRMLAALDPALADAVPGD